MPPKMINEVKTHLCRLRTFRLAEFAFSPACSSFPHSTPLLVICERYFVATSHKHCFYSYPLFSQLILLLLLLFVSPRDVHDLVLASIVSFRHQPSLGAAVPLLHQTEG